MWLTVYSVFAAHIGLVTTIVSSRDEELDAAWEKINAVRLVSPSSWPLGAVEKVSDIAKLVSNADALHKLITEIYSKLLNQE